METNRVQHWSIGGGYVEICSCDTTCPCNFLAEPSEGLCNVAFAFDVRNGSYGKIDLKGRRVVLVVRAPSHMMEGNWKAALYIDDAADNEQRQALEAIFCGKAGGHMQKLVGFVTEFAGVKYVPIKISSDVDRRFIEIPEILNATVQALKGNNGSHVILENMPLTFWLPDRVTAAKQERFKFADKDFGLEWEWEGKHGAYTNFEWAGP